MDSSHILKLAQLELDRLCTLVEVVQLEVLEVADKDVAGQLAFLETGEVFQSLLLGADKITARALLFNEQSAFPEQIDETTTLPQ